MWRSSSHERSHESLDCEAVPPHTEHRSPFSGSLVAFSSSSSPAKHAIIDPERSPTPSSGVAARRSPPILTTTTPRTSAHVSPPQSPLPSHKNTPPLVSPHCESGAVAGLSGAHAVRRNRSPTTEMRSANDKTLEHATGPFFCARSSPLLSSTTALPTACGADEPKLAAERFVEETSSWNKGNTNVLSDGQARPRSLHQNHTTSCGSRSSAGSPQVEENVVPSHSTSPSHCISSEPNSPTRSLHPAPASTPQTPSPNPLDEKTAKGVSVTAPSPYVFVHFYCFLVRSLDALDALLKHNIFIFRRRSCAGFSGASSAASSLFTTSVADASGTMGRRDGSALLQPYASSGGVVSVPRRGVRRGSPTAPPTPLSTTVPHAKAGDLFDRQPCGVPSGCATLLSVPVMGSRERRSSTSLSCPSTGAWDPSVSAGSPPPHSGSWAVPLASTPTLSGRSSAASPPLLSPAAASSCVVPPTTTVGGSAPLQGRHGSHPLTERVAWESGTDVLAVGPPMERLLQQLQRAREAYRLKMFPQRQSERRLRHEQQVLRERKSRLLHAKAAAARDQSHQSSTGDLEHQTLGLSSLTDEPEREGSEFDIVASMKDPKTTSVSVAEASPSSLSPGHSTGKEPFTVRSAASLPPPLPPSPSASIAAQSPHLNPHLTADSGRRGVPLPVDRLTLTLHPFGTPQRASLTSAEATGLRGGETPATSSSLAVPRSRCLSEPDTPRIADAERQSSVLAASGSYAAPLQKLDLGCSEGSGEHQTFLRDVLIETGLDCAREGLRTYFTHIAQTASTTVASASEGGGFQTPSDWSPSAGVRSHSFSRNAAPQENECHPEESPAASPPSSMPLRFYPAGTFRGFEVPTSTTTRSAPHSTSPETECGTTPGSARSSVASEYGPSTLPPALMDLLVEQHQQVLSRVWEAQIGVKSSSFACGEVPEGRELPPPRTTSSSATVPPTTELRSSITTSDNEHCHHRIHPPQRLAIHTTCSAASDAVPSMLSSPTRLESLAAGPEPSWDSSLASPLVPFHHQSCTPRNALGKGTSSPSLQPLITLLTERVVNALRAYWMSHPSFTSTENPPNAASPPRCSSETEERSASWGGGAQAAKPRAATLKPEMEPALRQSNRALLSTSPYAARFLRACGSLAAFEAARSSMQEIVDGLWCGSFHPAANYALLKAMNITHICVCIGTAPRFPNDFHYCVLDAEDNDSFNIRPFFDETFSFIDEALKAYDRQELVEKVWTPLSASSAPVDEKEEELDISGQTAVLTDTAVGNAPVTSSPTGSSLWGVRRDHDVSPLTGDGGEGWTSFASPTTSEWHSLSPVLPGVAGLPFTVRGRQLAPSFSAAKSLGSFGDPGLSPTTSNLQGAGLSISLSQLRGVVQCPSPTVPRGSSSRHSSVSSGYWPPPHCEIPTAAATPRRSRSMEGATGVPLGGEPPNETPLPESSRRAGGVLIHCGAGISRAPTITAAYLMRKFKLSSSAALQMVKERRPYARPNNNFTRQLQQFHKELVAAAAVKSGATPHHHSGE